MLQEGAGEHLVPAEEGASGTKITKRAMVLRLWDEGEHSAEELARKSGATVGSVRCFLSRAGRSNRANESSKNKPYTIRAPISIEVVAQERYKCTGSALIRRMIDIIAKEDLYVAVLGDG